MLTRSPAPPPRPGSLQRFGPLTVILVAIAVVAGVASFDRHDPTATTVAGAGAGSPSRRADSNVPVTYADAKKAGTLASYQFGPNCDPATGRLKLPTVYAPPCLAAPNGVAGGATAKGVTATTITVVLYQAADQDLAAVLQSKLDPQSRVEQTQQAFIDMFQRVYQTWGRTLVIKRIKGTGVDETSARADAVKVADELGAFASIGGPSQAPAYADELASRGVICIECGLGVPDSTYQKNAPFMWGPLQTPEQFLINVGDFIVQRLLGRKAVHAGDPALQARKRVFGVVHFEQDPPVFSGVEKVVAEQGAKRGFRAAVNLSYLLDLARLPEEARTIIAKLKAEHVTTVIFLGDPLMPINLTKIATEQGYFPEWIITGTVLTDTTTLGRLYDQKQWRHAFGVSSIAVPTGQQNAEGWSLHRWYYGTDPVAAKTTPLIYEQIALFMLGVHMAGPDLTPQTFQAGMFQYPVSGGGPTHGQVSYGKHGVFKDPDYLSFDDMTEIWWDGDAKGPDEQGVVGTGMVRYANGGRRYLPGKMPDRPDDAFKLAGSVTMLNPPPPGDRAPSYPPPHRGG